MCCFNLSEADGPRDRMEIDLTGLLIKVAGESEHQSAFVVKDVGRGHQYIFAPSFYPVAIHASIHPSIYACLPFFLWFKYSNRVKMSTLLSCGSFYKVKDILYKCGTETDELMITPNH